MTKSIFVSGAGWREVATPKAVFRGVEIVGCVPDDCEGVYLSRIDGRAVAIVLFRAGFGNVRVKEAAAQSGLKGRFVFSEYWRDDSNSLARRACNKNPALPIVDTTYTDGKDASDLVLSQAKLGGAQDEIMPRNDVLVAWGLAPVEYAEYNKIAQAKIRKAYLSGRYAAKSA